MTGFKTDNYEALDYCIELSKMIKMQEPDEKKMHKLFREITNMQGGRDYLIDYSNKNDHTLGSFCLSVMNFSVANHIPIELGLEICYRVHINMPKGEILFTPTDDEDEIKRRNKVASEVYERVFSPPEPEAESTRKQGVVGRILRFFMRK